MKYKAILFDFDGTIIDTMNEYALLASKIISKYTQKNPEEVKKKYLETAGRDFPTQLILMGIKDPLRLVIYEEFKKEKIKLLKNIEISKQVIEFLESLRKRGYLTALSTNNECEVIKNIKGLNAFDIILCFDGRNHRKGKPHLETLLKKYNLKKEEIVFIGDTEYDLEIYKPYNIKTLKTSGLYYREEQKRIMNELSKND